MALFISLHMILSFYLAKKWGRRLLKTMWEREEMLVTSIFSFSLSVFYTAKRQIGLFEKEFHMLSAHAFTMCKTYILSWSPSLNKKKVLDWSSLKTIADDKLNIA